MTHRGNRSPFGREQQLSRRILIDATHLSLDTAYIDHENRETINRLTPNQIETNLTAMKNPNGTPRYTNIPRFVPKFFEPGLVMLDTHGRGALELKPDLSDCFTGGDV